MATSPRGGGPLGRPLTTTRRRRLRRAPPGALSLLGDRRGEDDVRVFAAVHDELEELVQRRGERGVDVVAQVDPRGERRVGRAAQRVAAHGPVRLAPGLRAGARRWPTMAIAARTEAPLRKRACSRVARASRVAVWISATSAEPVSAADDGRLVVRRLIAQRQVLEAVAQRLRQAARGDVLHGVLRRHHLEARHGPHFADVGHLHEALVQRRQQHVLHRLGHAVELVDEQHAALAHGLDERARGEGLLAVALLQHQGGSNQPVSLLSE